MRSVDIVDFDSTPEGTRPLFWHIQMVVSGLDNLPKCQSNAAAAARQKFLRFPTTLVEWSL
jgi:hypothetical protein